MTRRARQRIADIALAVLVGVISGLGAAAFYLFLQLCTRSILTGVGLRRPWATPLIVAAGAFVGTLLVRLFARDAEGHGTDATIDAIHHDPSGTPARTGLVKLLAAGVTIGSGGSGGSEGPAAQITAAGASLVTRRFRVPYERAKVLVTVGLGAGVGAIFRVPVGGALLGVEITYRSDMVAAAVGPGLFASPVAYAVFGLCVGSFAPIFGGFPSTHLNLAQLLFFPPIGLVAGLVGRLYVGTFYRAVALIGATGRWIPSLLRPALAGLAVGGIGLLVPGVLGTGYGTAQAVLDRQQLAAIPLWLLLFIPLAKILATSLSIGSGGSGGIFGPGLVIGATTGALLWRLADLTGIAPASPVCFVIAGMAACVGAAVRAPVALILMAVESTRDPGLLIPAMLATATAVLVMGDATLFRSQLPTRDDDPAAHERRAAVRPTVWLLGSNPGRLRRGVQNRSNSPRMAEASSAPPDGQAPG